MPTLQTETKKSYKALLEWMLTINDFTGFHLSPGYVFPFAFIYICIIEYFYPRRACAARVTVVVSCVCLSVCLSVCVSVRTRYSGSARDYKYNEKYHCVKRQICGNIKMAFFFKLSYSKIRAFLLTSAGVAIFS